MTQPDLAQLAEMSQPRISEIERPGERKLTLETLLRLASAFDVALQVRFIPFSQFVDDNDTVDLDNFHVTPFQEDMAALAKYEEQSRDITEITAWLPAQAIGSGQSLARGAWQNAANVARPAQESPVIAASQGIKNYAA